MGKALRREPEGLLFYCGIRVMARQRSHTYTSTWLSIHERWAINPQHGHMILFSIKIFFLLLFFPELINRAAVLSVTIAIFLILCITNLVALQSTVISAGSLHIVITFLCAHGSSFPKGPAAGAFILQDFYKVRHQNLFHFSAFVAFEPTVIHVCALLCFIL